MRKALAALDGKLSEPVQLLIGGGAAMLLAHGFPVATMDIDGLVYKGALTQSALDRHAKVVAREVGVPADWLNSYFNTFLYTLPADFATRLMPVYRGKYLAVVALGAEDLLVLKCFAGRPKDLPHARALCRKVRDLSVVDNHLQQLLERRVPGAVEAADFFDQLQDDAVSS